MDYSISLLQATYRRATTPVEVKLRWLETADRPELVEHVFAMDSTDQRSIDWTSGHVRVIQAANGEWASTVTNWNAAAVMASGGLLAVIADDLFPPEGWDTRLREFVGGLDPSRARFVIKVADSPGSDDTLLRHPVMSRAFYAKHGLFSEAYHGVFCDHDLTLTAFWREVILDGRTLVLDHRHPYLDPSVEVSESQAKGNRAAEYEYGRAAFRARWPRWRARARIRTLPHDPRRPLDEALLRRTHRRYVTLEAVMAPLRLVRGGLSRAWRSGRAGAASLRRPTTASMDES